MKEVLKQAEVSNLTITDLNGRVICIAIEGGNYIYVETAKLPDLISLLKKFVKE